LLLIFIGTLLAVAMSVVWVVGSARWEEVDSHDPRKVLAQEVFATLKAHTPGLSRNGHAPDSSNSTDH